MPGWAHLLGRPLEGGGGQVQACPSWAYPPPPFPVTLSPSPPSEPPCHERVSQEGLLQPSKLARTHGPGGREARFWVRAEVGLED